jgi:hypothetical protein
VDQPSVRCARIWKAALAGALLFGAQVGWANNTACAGTYDLAADSTGLVAGGSASGGCEIYDTNFTTFNFTQGTGPAGSSISVNFYGALTGNAGDDSPKFTGNWTAGMTTTIGETATIDNANSANPPPAGTQYEFTALTLGVANIGDNGSGNVVVFEQFCLGSATFNCTSTSGDYGYIQLVYNQLGTAGEFTCLNAGASSCVVSSTSFNSVYFTSYLPEGTPVIAMQTTVTTSGSGTANLGSFENFVDFTAETPEPATFGLMGFALCGCWLLFRFSKPASSKG